MTRYIDQFQADSGYRPGSDEWQGLVSDQGSGRGFRLRQRVIRMDQVQSKVKVCRPNNSDKLQGLNNEYRCIICIHWFG